MFSNNSRKALATALAGAALASAVGASGAAADQYMDLRSPDAREAALAEQPYTDLRMPDSVEPARGERSAWRRLRPRSRNRPATRTRTCACPTPASRPKGPARAPDAQPVADEPSTPGAFDWLSAALGAAAGAGLVLVLFAAGGMRRLSGPARA